MSDSDESNIDSDDEIPEMNAMNSWTADSGYTGVQNSKSEVALPPGSHSLNRCINPGDDMFVRDLSDQELLNKLAPRTSDAQDARLHGSGVAVDLGDGNPQENLPMTPQNKAFTLYQRGNACHMEGDYKSARTYHEQSLVLKQQLFGVEAANADVASSLHALGSVHYRVHNYTSARKYHGES